jgi:hypothetical protein
MRGNLKSVPMIWNETHPTPVPCHSLPADALLVELARLEGSGPLASAPKLRKLLRYLFSETLSSHGSAISQYTIAFDCYGLGDTFDPAANTLIRSHAGRLRRLLKELAPPEDGVRILMKEKGYQLYFELAGEPGVPVTVPSQSPTLGVLEFEEMGEIGSGQLPAKTLAARLMIELADHNGAAPQGPFPRSLLEAHRGHLTQFSRDLGLDFLLDGSFCEENGAFVIYPRILEGRTGNQLWAPRNGISTTGVAPDDLLALARRLAAEAVGDWGALSKHATRNALSRSGEWFPVYEAVMLARQYLTHFNFEYLGRCVQTLREAAVDTEDAAIPATLAVLLSSACSVEPRWSEPMDREEIHQLAARAARLGPEDPWTRLALAMSAMLGGQTSVLLEIAKHADEESDSPIMLVGSLGSILCFQSLDVERGRRMLERYCRESPNYPRLVHLALALVAFGADDISTTKAELARFGVPWGWAFPLVAGACAASEGNVAMAQSEWLRVLAAFPSFPQRWRDTVATQWHEDYLLRIFRALESVGVKTGCR